jgi:hypothetical protein
MFGLRPFGVWLRGARLGLGFYVTFLFLIWYFLFGISYFQPLQPLQLSSTIFNSIIDMISTLHLGHWARND